MELHLKMPYLKELPKKKIVEFDELRNGMFLEVVGNQKIMLLLVLEDHISLQQDYRVQDKFVTCLQIPSDHDRILGKEWARVQTLSEAWCEERVLLHFADVSDLTFTVKRPSYLEDDL